MQRAVSRAPRRLPQPFLSRQHPVRAALARLVRRWTHMRLGPGPAAGRRAY